MTEEEREEEMRRLVGVGFKAANESLAILDPSVSLLDPYAPRCRLSHDGGGCDDRSLERGSLMEYWVEIIAATEDAVLVEIEGDEVWIPRSQIEDNEEWSKGDTGDMVMSEWFAKKEGWL